MSNDLHTIYPETDGRLERDGKVIVWENPDAPDHREMLGEELRFFCPNPDCSDELEFKDFEERDELVAALEQTDGTFRCGGTGSSGCNEPIYGIFGDGDHA